MTSIYQIIESYGQIDDYHERVYATYLNLDRALKDLQTLQELEDIKIKQGKECAKCPEMTYDGINHSCPRANYKDRGFGPECENFDLHQDPYNYYINSIDVIE